MTRLYFLWLQLTIAWLDMSLGEDSCLKPACLMCPPQCYPRPSLSHAFIRACATASECLLSSSLLASATAASPACSQPTGAGEAADTGMPACCAPAVLVLHVHLVCIVDGPAL